MQKLISSVKYGCGANKANGDWYYMTRHCKCGLAGSPASFVVQLFQSLKMLENSRILMVLHHGSKYI